MLTYMTPYAESYSRCTDTAGRLTRLEYGHTIRDLLSIGGDVANDLPAENDSGSFGTVGSTQRISAVHMASYYGQSGSANGAGGAGQSSSRP